MSSLSERLTRGSASPSQVDHARRLVADWQLLADLAFADLTLWVPLRTGAWWCVAQVRPLTAPTSRPEDMVGVTRYLASRAGAYLTGTVIPVDGGISTVA